MARFDTKGLKRMRRQVLMVMSGPQALAFLPAICLASFWIGGEAALLAVAAILPVLYLLAGADGTSWQRLSVPRHAVSGLISRVGMEELVEQLFDQLTHTGMSSAAFMVELEDFPQLAERYGQAAADTVITRTGERLVAVLRDQDCVGQVGDARFAVCLDPVKQLDLELCIQLASRMQAGLEEPISIDGTAIYVTGSIGFCQFGHPAGNSGASWLEAATTALREAQRHGPASIRAYSEQMQKETASRAELRDEVLVALDTGQIQPWFQPQISTDTGRISGFEALARWQHPTRGMISPAKFLPAIEAAGLLERLAEVMMYHSFAALKAWDGSDVHVPQVGVNFAGSELNNPQLLDKIKWELDRFDLSPDRLAVEVLETVVADAPDDMVTRNIKALGELGCRIDLDDFGTGHASIGSIRRFSVSRIKIDRSFVMKADRDPEQQRMIGAILTMAERLGVETLAEGVESVGEHVLLSQLGCDHVQGFGVARPMPFDQTLEWIQAHNAKLQDVPQIIQSKKSG